MTNAYVSLATFKDSGIANVSGTGNDTRLLELLEGSGRQFEGYLGRHFYSLTATRYFTGNGKSKLWLPSGWDLISITTLKEDTASDAAYATTWAATDYFLSPYENDPAPGVNLGWSNENRPYRKLEINQLSTGSKKLWTQGQRRFELAGKWGYCECTEDTGATINEGSTFSDSDTTLTVNDGTKISVGDTLLIESEQIYVTAKSTNDLTVERGVNGTTAATHVDTTAISRFVYPKQLVEAVVMHASRLWTRRAAGYSEEAGFEATGIISPIKGLGLDVRQMLDAFRIPTLE